jgi:hypothetical protein
VSPAWVGPLSTRFTKALHKWPWERTGSCDQDTPKRLFRAAPKHQPTPLLGKGHRFQQSKPALQRTRPDRDRMRVASVTTVWSGPRRSATRNAAASTIASAMRSFMLPAGVSYSSLTRIQALGSGTM